MSNEVFEARQQLVQHQLQMRGISDQRVLAAMASVPREEFVPANVANRRTMQSWSLLPLPNFLILPYIC